MNRDTIRGAALITTLIVGTAVTLASASVAALVTGVADRVTVGTKLERTRSIGDVGLAFFVEHWRDSATFLDYTDGAGGAPADGKATTAAENAEIGVVREFGSGTFTLTEIRDEQVTADTVAKTVRVLAVYDRFRYTWEALLAPNLVSPIQGVGTTDNQSWTGGATFDTLGGGSEGSVFGNGSFTASGAGTSLTGDVDMGGTATVTSPAVVDGTVSGGAATITFPDKTAIVNAELDAARLQTASYWTNPQTAMTVGAGAVREFIVGDATKMNYGRLTGSNTNTPLKHMLMRGGVSSLPAGNYAFGRLWLDNAILTIKAPPGGGALVLPDLYLTNGARLIIDATDGQFDVIAAKNNSYKGYIGGTATLNIDGDKWNSASGGTATTAAQSGSTSVEKVKVLKGSTYGSGSGSHDDWQIANGSLVAVVTASSLSKGAEMYIPQDTDFVLANGGLLIGGLEATDLAALQNASTTMATIGAMDSSATGFLAWSSGGGHPRLDINAGTNGGSTASSFTGLTYGGFKGTIGAIGSLAGAFVGQTMTTKGDFHYDPRLADLLVDPQPDTEHVVVKYRVEG